MTYFQRALKLNPQYTSAWTLMGHEFMERKNTSAAIEAYRKAIGIYTVVSFNALMIMTSSLAKRFDFLLLYFEVFLLYSRTSPGDHLC